MPSSDSPPAAPSAPSTGPRDSARATRRLALRWARRVLLALFALGIVAAVVVAAMPKPVEVDLTEVRRGPLRVTVDEDARTRVKDRYVISAPLGGGVTRIELRPGDPVRAGQVIARVLPLAPPLLDERTRAEALGRVATAAARREQVAATIERVRTNLQLARSEAERQRALAEREAAPAQLAERAEMEARSLAAELASAQFGARVASYELETARATLGRLRPGAPRGDTAAGAAVAVTSPVDGRVLRVIQQSESVVQPGAPLLEVGDPATLEIVVDLLTSDAVMVRPGMPVELDRWGGDGVLAGRVRTVEPSAFTRLSALGVEEQRVNVVVDLESPRASWTSLGDGYGLDAHVVIWSQPEVVQVPASAVFRRGEGWAVFAVDGERARLRAVTLGRRGGTANQVLAGLRPGEHVVAHPSDRVTEGVRVSAR